MAFSIRCQACETAFSLDEHLFEQRVANKAVTFQCPNCGKPSTVDAGAGAVAALESGSSAHERALKDSDFITEQRMIAELTDEEVASLPPEALPAAQARPPPRPRLESKIDDELWVVSVKEGAEDQEIFESSLIELIGDGKMPGEAIVWREGMTAWLPLADVPELSKYLPHVAQASFGSNAGERHSARPPLPPNRRSQGSAQQKSAAAVRGDLGMRPVALSPGFLFSVDDAPSEPPEKLAKGKPGKSAPKPPRRAVTRDLEFSDIAEDEVPMSGTPALKHLTTLVKPGGEAKAPQRSEDFFAALGGVEEEVLAPPSIDISNLSGVREQTSGRAEVLGQASDAAAERRALDEPSSRAPEATRTKQNANDHNTKGESHRKKSRSSKRPSGRGSSKPAPGSRSSGAPKARSESHSSPAAPSQKASIPRQKQDDQAGWMTPGRIFALLAIAGLAYFLFSRALGPDGSQPQPEPDQQAEALQQPEKPSPEPLAGPDAVEDPVAQEPAPTAAATASVPAAPTPRAGAANAPPSKVKPSASEAQAERVAEPKTALEAPATPAPKQPTPTPSNEDAPPFNQEAAIGALNRAVAQASGCRQEGDPSGTARVVITFAPSGRVTSANLSGPPFAGTRTGGCIAATMRGATVPAFSGTHVTVSKSVVIR